MVPNESRSDSRGRFLAFDQQTEIIDPAILREGIRAAITGEVLAPTVERLGDSDYEYPTLAICDMTVWDIQTVAAPGGACIDPYWTLLPAGTRPYSLRSESRVAG